MLTCYLDDSYAAEGPTVAISGHFAPPEIWGEFEKEAQKVFRHWDVDIFHAVDFHNTRGAFANWGFSKKKDFILAVCGMLTKFQIFGISSSISIQYYNDELKNKPGMQNMSALGIAFGTALAGIMFKFPIRNQLPISFVIEDGHKNNSNLLTYFNYLKSNIRETDKWTLNDLRFATKSECRAVQIADLISFYGRRTADTWHKNGYSDKIPDDPFMHIIWENSPMHFERVYKRDEANTGNLLDPNGLPKSLFIAPGTRGI